jgi:uncharacterized membrane protein
LEEKRKYQRMDVQYDVFLTRKGQSTMSKARDVSTHGVGLYVNEAAEPGEAVELTIVVPAARLNLKLDGTVRHCAENPDPEIPLPFITGIEFSENKLENMEFLDLKEELFRYQASHTVAIDAPAHRCYEFICDFERYPQWAGVLKKAKVEERYPDGRARRVEFELDAYIRKIIYILDYFYDDDGRCLSWLNAGGDMVSVTGRYFFKPISENQASSNYELEVAFDFFMPNSIIHNRLVRYFSSVVMRKTMKGFKKFVEKGGR